MNDRVFLQGMVLRVSPVGDADRRLVLLTRERGKITAFAKNARRPGSSLVGCTRPFVFGTMELFEGRSTYNLIATQVINAFDGVTTDLEASCYGSYFLEFADYYAREGLEAGEMLKLLYVTLGALTKQEHSKKLIRSVYELKCMAINGEYAEKPLGACAEAAEYAWGYVLRAPYENLYRFDLEPSALESFAAQVRRLREYYIEAEFRSLEILKTLDQGML